MTRGGMLAAVLAFLLSVTHGASAAATTAVVVEKAPVVVVHRTFDPQRPTDDMPDLTPPEIGLCISEFGCEIRMTTSTIEGRAADTRIDAIRMVLRLKITIWTRVLAPQREIVHEEGHRAISEAYYGEADVIARGLAEGVVGQRLFRVLRKKRIASPAGGGTVRASIDALQSRLIEEYLAQTHWRCAFAQESFDDITDHGRNEISEAEAMVRAMAEEQANHQR